MSEVTIKQVIENIKRIRLKDAISQEYMAAKLNMGQNAYSKIELGKTQLTVDHLICIADALGIEVAELINSSPLTP